MLSSGAEALDALFVVNQKVDLTWISRECATRGYRKALVVTSHALFDSEERELKDGASSCEIRASCFNDWLDDAAMQGCDDTATAILASGLRDLGVRRRYSTLFMDESLYQKNKALGEALRRRVRWQAAWFADGLGISARYWLEQGATSIGESSPPARRALPGTLARVAAFARFLSSPTSLHRLEAEGRTFYFTSIRRLHIRSGFRVDLLQIGRLRKLVAALAGFTANPARILRRLVGERAVLASTIHAYPSYLLEDPEPVQVFLDGFHPSNYPRTYLDMYGRCVFASWDPLSTEWFIRHGRSVVPVPAFIDAKHMQLPSAGAGCRRVLLALNHAGDWTALINRSDTDRLVQAFCNVARTMPDVDFVIRPHPTMNHSDHEGPQSRQRIERYVQRLGLRNLSVSNGSLADDLSNCDVVVSEYSQVLIDALHAGRIGLIANLTGRRSFMVDYERSGFSGVSDEAGMSAWLRETVRDPAAAVLRQAAAVERYNIAFEAFMRSHEGP